MGLISWVSAAALTWSSVNPRTCSFFSAALRLASATFRSASAAWRFLPAPAPRSNSRFSRSWLLEASSKSARALKYPDLASPTASLWSVTSSWPALTQSPGRTWIPAMRAGKG